jgi:hypothetical protein
MNSILIIDYHFSLSELDSMIPFEREIHVALIQKRLKEEAKRKRRQ